MSIETTIIGSASGGEVKLNERIQFCGTLICKFTLLMDCKLNILMVLNFESCRVQNGRSTKSSPYIQQASSMTSLLGDDGSIFLTSACE